MMDYIPFSQGQRLLEIPIRMKYWGRTEVVSRVLESAAVGKSATRIMHMVFDSYAQLEEYPEVLENVLGSQRR